jgi:hypothetical protein
MHIRSRSIIRRSLTPVLMLAAPVAYSGVPVEWTVTPYAWGIGLNGNLRHDQLPITVRPRVGFNEIWDNLDMAGMLAISAQGESFGVFADGVFADLSTMVDVPVGSLRVPVDVDAKARTGLIAMQYRLVREGRSNLDLVLGARYWSAETRFRYMLPASFPESLPIPRQYRLTEDGQWWDLQLGVKGNYTFGNGMYVGGWAMTGGNRHERADDLMGVIGYRATDRLSVFIGYRYLATSYEASRGFMFDVAAHGPGIGLDVHF